MLWSRFSVTAIYFGLLFDTDSLRGDIYVNAAVSLLLEVPAKFLTSLVIERKVSNIRLFL